MRRPKISVAAALAVALLAVGVEVRPRAQSLSSGLFDRYVEALRQE